MKNVLILGAGFGGLELSTRLSESMSDEVRVTLIDRSDGFTFGFTKFDVLFGKKTPDEVKLRYREIDKPSVEFRQEDVLSIDAVNKHVRTNNGEYEPDILVVALGADYAPDATPGFVEGGYEYYSVPGAERMRDVLPSITGGRLLMGVLGVPYKCPPAPYEALFLLHDYFVQRGVRDKIEMHFVNPMPSPLPPSPAASATILANLDERGVTYEFGRRIAAIDPSAKTAKFGSGEEIAYDTFVGIPVHRSLPVVEASGLTEGGTDGWIKVDARNLETPHPDVYAIGDCADAPVPRAGSLAENAAGTVASAIGARLHGEPFDDRYLGRGVCFMEFGRGLVGKVEVDFLTGDTPQAPLIGPSADLVRDKDDYAASHRKRWFGLD